LPRGSLQRVTVIGAGAWGTTIASLLAANGSRVLVWSYFEHVADEMNRLRENTEYLPGVRLPNEVEATADLRKALEWSDFWILASPSHTVREIAARAKSVKNDRISILSVVKGLEEATHYRMEQVIREFFGDVEYAALSGPNLAREVCLGHPTSTVVASSSERLMKSAQALLATPTLRVYSSTDVTGVELGGSLKNVYSIGAGIVDGLRLGDNTKAAFLTRSLVEMTRLGVALGARGETFGGLSGIGDLIATSYSRYSRNRGFGEQVGAGREPLLLLESSKVAIEGARTTRAVVDFARSSSIDTPIAFELEKIIYRGKSPHDAIRDLMTRELKGESDG
jgi:glycerol-3-phosphate dehydrogenase (NAD(P)+)